MYVCSCEVGELLKYDYTWVKSAPSCGMKWYDDKNMWAEKLIRCELVEVAAYGSEILHDVENTWNKLKAKARPLSTFKQLLENP
jgi:hypothetical protein